MPQVRVHHPLLAALREFDGEASKRFPAPYDEGLGQMGLLLTMRLEYGGYWCTPMNSLSFGGTGGDGVHFSFIVIDNAITEDSPVIVTSPASSETTSDVVADNLRNFLCASLTRGFCAHEALGTFLHRGTHPFETRRLRGNAALVRDALAERFALTPLHYTLEEQRALQDRYEPMLVYPPELGEGFEWTP
jgi:hypothetical protein